MNSVAEAVSKITEKEDSCKDEVKKHEKRLHGKDGEVSKHVEKMHKEESELDEAEKVMTSTGMKVYGSSYGNSAKARRDQTKKDIDTIKGPKSKDLVKQDKDEHEKTKGQYDEAAKPDFLDLDGDKNEKESMKKAAADKKMKEDTEFKDKLIEALKGNQHKIDKNKNNKIDSQDFKILRGEKKVSEAKDEQEYGYEGDMALNQLATLTRCAEMIKDLLKPDTDMPEWVQSKITLATDYIQTAADYMYSEMKEEVESIEEKKMTDDEMAKREKIVKSMKKGFAGFRQRYGKDAKSVMYATATKQAMKEDTVEEEIDPKVRTKDTLRGQEPTAQKDDVGPGSDAKSTKVKFRGGPMKEEVKKSDIPAFIRKARGDKPLTVADVKSGSKDSISSKENLAKARGVQEGKHPESDTVPFVTNAEQPPFDGPYKKIGGTVTDKSGAKHTPMSRAKDLARQAMKRIKTEMIGKAPGNNG
jgi:hypothetical protein